MKSDLCALAAIALWATLAPLGVSLSHVPPFLLTGIALRHAPAVEANLVNYLWPLGMVVLAPLMLRGMRLRWAHVGAARRHLQQRRAGLEPHFPLELLRPRVPVC